MERTQKQIDDLYKTYDIALKAAEELPRNDNLVFDQEDLIFDLIANMDLDRVAYIAREVNDILKELIEESK